MKEWEIPFHCVTLNICYMQEKSRTLYQILCSSFFNPQILFEPFLLLPWDLTEGPSSQPLFLSSLEFKAQEQELGGWVPNISPEILKLGLVLLKV